jgi:hypothetical protein
MLKLGKLRRSDPRTIFERVPATELADLRGQVQAIGRSQAVIEFALDGTIQTARVMAEIRTAGTEIQLSAEEISSGNASLSARVEAQVRAS